MPETLRKKAVLSVSKSQNSELEDLNQRFDMKTGGLV